ncbi:MAG: CoA pyrophosphatase [Desulfosalsimonadaceae bacterium]
MSLSFDTDLLRHITAAAEAPGPPRGASSVRTSVFLLIFNRHERPFLLAVLKADNHGYPWRNQVALPGGHIDETDSSALAAAYRELEEEMQINSEEVSFICSLGHFPTIQQKDIEVFLGFWEGSPEEISFDRREIARVLEVSIPMLLQRHMEKHFHGRIPGVSELTYPAAGVVIWGATARIIHFFLELLRSRLSAAGLEALLSEA